VILGVFTLKDKCTIALKRIDRNDASKWKDEPILYPLCIKAPCLLMLCTGRGDKAVQRVIAQSSCRSEGMATTMQGFSERK